jgi:ABC-type branched-subunit amino acid transport system ATPase component
LRAISGLLPVDEGSVQKSGSNIHGDSPESIAKRGMALVPGGRGVFPSLSVAENLRLAAWLIRGDAGAVQEARRRQFELFPVLASRLQQRAGDLSGGEQQMLSLAMALMVRPEILLIDELSLGLAPTVVAELLAIVRRLNAEGVTIVVVEQSISVALDLAERAVFMEKGEVRFTGDSPDLLSRPDLLRSVFIRGGPSSAAADHPMPPERVVAAADALGPIDPDAPLLSLRGVTKRFGGVTAANGVNMELRPHEILGLIGHNGAGKTTLMDIVSGFIPLDQGRIFCQGVDIGLMAPHERATLGMGRTFQNAGLFPSLTVKETLSVSYERHLVSRGLLAPGLRLPASLDAEADLAEEAEELLEFMGLVDYSEKLIGELSTGTRRIVELACVLAQRPAVLLLDEPSGGVAQRETEAMGPLLLEVRERTGCSILVVEHDMPLLAAICGRMIALELGEVIAEGTPREILEHPQVIASYLGSDTTAINRSAPGAVGQPIAAIR